MKSDPIVKVLLIATAIVLLAVLLSDISDAESGTCGDSVVWTYDTDTLTVSGQGAMYDYPEDDAPWKAFASDITKVVIGDGISTIGTKAFSGLSIVSFSAPDSVESIRNGAFDGCTDLRTVSLGKGLGSFSSELFRDSKKLDSVTVSDDNPYIFDHGNVIYFKRNSKPYLIPQGITSTEIPAGTPSGSFMTGENGSFSACTKLSRIDVEDGNAHYRSFNGVLFTKDLASIICVPRAKTGTFTIPNATTDALYAFIGSSLSRVILGSGIKNVTDGHLLFASENTPNQSLKRLDIGSSVTNLENTYSTNGRFTMLRWCSAVEIVTAEGNPLYGAVNGMLFTKSGNILLYVPAAATEVTVPDNVARIGNRAFRDCMLLERVTLPDSVVSLENNAFDNCPALTRIDYGAGLDCQLKTDMFVGCGALTEFHTDSNSKYYTLSDGAVYRTSGELKMLSFVPTGLTSFTVTDDTAGMDDYAFRSNKKIQTVTVGTGVESIRNSQFAECSNLTEAILPASLVSIGNLAFHRTGLTAILLPSSIVSIGDSSFKECTSLASVTFQSGTTAIGPRSFYGCSGLAVVVLPAALTEIPEETFYGCVSLGTTAIPDTVGRIYDKAFYRCSSMGAVTLPESLTELGGSAFWECSSVRTIVFSGTGLTAIPEYAFYGLGQDTDAEIDLTVPEGVIDLGNLSFAWSNVTSVIFPDSLRTIGDSCFMRCPIAGTVALSGVQSIGNYAFSNTDITEAVFSEGLQSIGLGSFSSCGSLTRLETPTTLTSVDANAFSGCSSMMSIEMNSPHCIMKSGIFSACTSLRTADLNVESIGVSAFSSDSKLESVTFAGTVSIGRYAFFGCTSLRAVALSAELETLGVCCFNDCSRLESITVPSENQHFYTDGRALFSDNWSKLVAYYHGSGEPSYSIPDKTRSFWEGAFYNSRHLESLECGKLLQSSEMCYENFAGCVSLSSIEVVEGNTAMSSLDGAVYSRDRTMLLYGPPALAVCNLDPHTEVIKLRAFYGCTRLTSVRFSAYLTDIGDSAFYGCTSLTSINLQSVSSIGAKAFCGCTSLSRIVISETGSISFGKDCFDLGRESVIVGSSFDEGFLDDYLGSTKASYVGLEVDTRTGVEKARDNTPLIAGGVLAASVVLIGAEMIIRRKR